jgi:transcriptional regulator NrdR family protein
MVRPGFSDTAGSVPCPACGSHQSTVVDSRLSKKGKRRRRLCTACAFRFTTHESIELGEDALSGIVMKWLEKFEVHELRLRELEEAAQNTPVTTAEGR